MSGQMSFSHLDSGGNDTMVQIRVILAKLVLHGPHKIRIGAEESIQDTASTMLKFNHRAISMC